MADYSSQNAKDPKWQKPEKGLSGVSPQDYPDSLEGGDNPTDTNRGQAFTLSPSAKPGEEARERQKAEKQLPRHDEPIGGG
jgi:hypothetical protein